MLVPAWSATPPSMHTANASGEKLPATMAHAPPTRIGMMLAVNENGRVARYQTMGQPGLWSRGAPAAFAGRLSGSGIGLALQQAAIEQGARILGVRGINVFAHVEGRRHLLIREEVVQLLEVGHVHVAVRVMIRQR